MNSPVFMHHTLLTDLDRFIKTASSGEIFVIVFNVYWYVNVVAFGKSAISAEFMILGFDSSQGKIIALNRWGEEWNHLLVTHSLINNCAKNRAVEVAFKKPRLFRFF